MMQNPSTAFPSCSSVAGYANQIANQCVVNGKAAGQIFDAGGWNVILRADRCGSQYATEW
jgi:hypothetical protein